MICYTWRRKRSEQCSYNSMNDVENGCFSHVCIWRDSIFVPPTTVKNPQANAICERMHQTVGNILRTLSQVNPILQQQDANHIVDSALQASPGSLAFGRDMILNIPVVADWATLQQHRQQLIDHQLITANARRYSYDYQPGQEVLKLTYQPDKLQPRAHGPSLLNQSIQMVPLPFV